MEFKVIPVHEKELYEVAEDFHVSVDGVDIWVPRGFQYDGASIPAFAWQVVYTPFNPKVMIPAVAHDWQYHSHQVDREKADELFYILLKQQGVSESKSWTMYQAVRIAGELYWPNDDEDIEKLKALYEIHRDKTDIGKFFFPTGL